MNNKNHRRFIIIIIVLILLITIGGISLYKYKYSKSKNILEVSSNQLEAKEPNRNISVDDGYFELVGFGQLEINKNNRNLNLINPSENSVYLSFDVIYNDNVLYQTKLIEPGKMEQYDAYSSLDAGKHTIIYSINVYDINDQTPLWKGIKQEQEIIVKD